MTSDPAGGLDSAAVSSRWQTGQVSLQVVVGSVEAGSRSSQKERRLPPLLCGQGRGC